MLVFVSSSSGQIYPAPPNDNVAAAEGMIESKTVTRTMLGATTEPNEPEPQRPSVWFSWIATENGIARLQLSGITMAAMPGWSVHVFAGETWQQEIARAAGETGTVLQVEFNTAVGAKYLLGVKSDPSVVGSFRLLLTAGLPVPNDNFADRIVLSGTNLTIEVALEMATKEPGEWGVLDGTAFRSAWYEWTPPRPGELTVEVEAFGKTLNRWASAGLYTGWSNPFEWRSLRWLRPTFMETWWVEPSTNYAIAVDTASLTSPSAVTGPMEVRLKLKFTPPPENDEFEKRNLLEGERITFSGTLDAVTPDVFSTRRTVWYEWTALQNGLASVAVIEPQAVSSTIFYSSNGVLTAIGKIPGSMGATNFFETQAGTNYFIAVHSSWGWPGYDFEARIDMGGPENDNFEDRVRLEGVYATFRVMSFRASAETNEPPDLRNSTWWSWTAPYSGWATLRSDLSRFSVFTGASLELLEPVAVEHLGMPEWRLPMVIGFECTAGITYQICGHQFWPALRDSDGELDLTSLRFTQPVEGAAVRARERVQIQMAPIDEGIDGQLRQPVVFLQAERVYYNDALVEGTGDPVRFITSFTDTGYEDKYGPRTYYAFTTNTAGVLKVSKPLRINLVLENDHFADATPIVTGPSLPRATFGKATLEAGEAELLNISGLPLVSRWWQWAPTVDSEMEFSVTANSGTLFAGVFHGTSFDSLEKVTNKLSSDSSVILRFQAMAGRRYYIALATQNDKGVYPMVRTSERTFYIGAKTGRVDVWYANALGGGYSVIERSADMLNWEPHSGAYAGAAFEYRLTNGPAYFFRARSE